jgi:hypothetical protein
MHWLQLMWLPVEKVKFIVPSIAFSSLLLIKASQSQTLGEKNISLL